MSASRLAFLLVACLLVVFVSSHLISAMGSGVVSVFDGVEELSSYGPEYASTFSLAERVETRGRYSLLFQPLATLTLKFDSVPTEFASSLGLSSSSPVFGSQFLRLVESSTSSSSSKSTLVRSRKIEKIARWMKESGVSLSLQGDQVIADGTALDASHTSIRTLIKELLSLMNSATDLRSSSNKVLSLQGLGMVIREYGKFSPESQAASRMMTAALNLIRKQVPDRTVIGVILTSHSEEVDVVSFAQSNQLPNTILSVANSTVTEYDIADYQTAVLSFITLSVVFAIAAVNMCFYMDFNQNDSYVRLLFRKETSPLA